MTQQKKKQKVWFTASSLFPSRHSELTRV